MRLERSVPSYGVDEEYTGHVWCAVVSEDVLLLINEHARQFAIAELEKLKESGVISRKVPTSNSQDGTEISVPIKDYADFCLAINESIFRLKEHSGQTSPQDYN